VNFYKHHIGDYDQATRHLSFVEDAAYSRLIRKYYAEEKPLPADVKQVQRLVGARARDEKDAVETVLGEFFVLEPDGWHNKRCDEEIAEAQESESERDEKKANERERQKRHRAERKQLFERLRSLDVVPAYDTPTETLRTLLSQRTSLDVTRDKTENVTREYGGGNAPVTRTATANQTPDTRHQTPDTRKEKTKRVTALSCSDLMADGLSEETANEWLAFRRQKRAPLTATAWEGIKREAAKAGWVMQDVVTKCMARGWQGFEADWVAAGMAKQRGPSSKQAEWNASIDEFLGETKQAEPFTIEAEYARIR